MTSEPALPTTESHGARSQQLNCIRPGFAPVCDVKMSIPRLREAKGGRQGAR